MDSGPLLQTVEAARRRLAARRAWRWAGRVALLLSSLVLLLVLASTVFPLELPVSAMAVVALAAGILTFAVVRIVARPTPVFAAQVLDHRFGCADLLTTAVEVITGRHRPTLLTPAVLEDAAQTAFGLDIRRRVPGGPDRLAAAAIAVAAAAMLASGALRGLSLPGTPARDVARTIQREGRRIQRAGQALDEQARAERARVTRRMAPTMQKLGEALQRDRMARSEALTRLESLGRQIDAERRQVSQRRQEKAGDRARPDPDLPAELFKQRAAVEQALRQIREIADRLAESTSPQEREMLMRQLATLAGEGQEGTAPARVREQAQTARQQAGAGDTNAARQTLQQSAADLEDLRAMLADEEGLTQAQRDLRRSAEQIARGGPSAPVDTEQAPQASAKGSVAPGDRPPSKAEGAEQTEAPPGPNQGTLPGQGTVAEKLGPRTARLETERQQSRIQGLQGQGRVTTSELLGPGRKAQVRVAQGPAVAAARADADRYMSRMRIPPEYREIVRRYFEALAASR